VRVDEINFTTRETSPGELISFQSIDTVSDENEIVNYSTVDLNSLDLPGFSLRDLRLKIGPPTILFIRNINAPWLCNGTK